MSPGEPRMLFALKNCQADDTSAYIISHNSWRNKLWISNNGHVQQEGWEPQQPQLAQKQDRFHHLAGSFLPPTPVDSSFSNGYSSPIHTDASGKPLTPRGPSPVPSVLSEGLWSDLKTMRWMRVPSSSFQMLLYPVIFYLNFHILQMQDLVPPHWVNPFEPLLFISHRIPDTPLEGPRYRKGYLDLLFIAYYVIFWSFIRQSITLYVFHPFARHFGIKKPSKLDRFGEQGYAMTYWGITSAMGIVVMWDLPTWWYRTEHFWIDYPHWQMTPVMKMYYLLQTAFWLQQLLVLLLRLEKPRKDYAELVIHHLVTIWLIGWSYLTNLTYIGNAVFLSMDTSDVCLAFAKLCNYLQLKKSKIVAFSCFLCVWTYFRHWLNLRILWSVWTEFDLAPEHAKEWRPEEGVYFVFWMKYQIFAPLLALQVVNLFWYFLMLRILMRTIFGSELEDDRSDDEGENESSNPTKLRRKNKPKQSHEFLQDPLNSVDKHD